MSMTNRPEQELEDGRETAFPPAEFAARRERVFERIGTDAVALIQGAGPVRGYEQFRQTNEFFYLCGIEAPQAYLLLDGRRRRSALYLPHRNPHSGEGESAEDAEEMKARFGIDAVSGWEEIATDLRNAPIIFTPHAPAEGRFVSRDVAVLADLRTASDPWDGLPSRESRFINRLRERFPCAAIDDLSPILDELRLIKSRREIALMRRAGALSAQAVRKAMRITRPGIGENELEALATSLFLSDGARGEAYRAIIPGGERIWDIHYFRNNAGLEDGDLVLMDCAPDLGYYASDIGRMWPVNGTYSPLQRELYGYVVRYHQSLLKRIRPGAEARQILSEAAEEMKGVVESISFSLPIYERAARRMLEFQGHLSHPVGMAVHDPGSYSDRPLQPGTVFSVDPQMWVPEEKLYLRAEDTGVVTETGFEIFTASAPLALDDVEAWMKG